MLDQTLGTILLFVAVTRMLWYVSGLYEWLSNRNSKVYQVSALIEMCCISIIRKLVRVSRLQMETSTLRGHDLCCF